MSPAEKENGKYVVVVGGMNIDVGGTSYKPLLMQDSNPGSIKVTPGGVGRNIAHNLALMGVDVRLLSACGQDGYGSILLTSCRNIGIGVEAVLVLPDMPTSCYLYIAGPDGDMVAAVNDMEICNKISPEYLESNKALLDNAAAVVMDANLPPDSIIWLAENCKAPLYCDPVSVSKAPKLIRAIPFLHAIKPNRYEAGLLSGVEIKMPEDAAAAADRLLGAGVEQVYISLGSEGVYAAEKGGGFLIPNLPGETVNTTGCGDAFMAALVYAGINSCNLRQSALAGLKASQITALSPLAVNPDIRGRELLCHNP